VKPLQRQEESVTARHDTSLSHPQKDLEQNRIQRATTTTKEQSRKAKAKPIDHNKTIGNLLSFFDLRPHKSGEF
jgi:hypothetical protein